MHHPRSGDGVQDPEGHGLQVGHGGVYRNDEHAVESVPKVQLKVLTKERETEKIAHTIVESARTGKIGDDAI
jgi:nitrogen regulatory protein PII